MYTEEVNKIAWSSDDDKRLQKINSVARYRYGTLAVKMCEIEMMVLRNLFVKKYVGCPFYGEIVLKKHKDKCFQCTCLKNTSCFATYKWSTLMITFMKIRPKIIKIDCIFQIIYT